MADHFVVDHERLEVYGLARAFAREGWALLQALPVGNADLADQFKRLLLSIRLNIAEGAGEFAPKEKARFYRIAKRSATEGCALLDHMVDFRLSSEAQITEAKTLVRRIIAALVKQILSTEQRARTQAAGTGGPTPAPAPAPAPTRKPARARDPYT